MTHVTLSSCLGGSCGCALVMRSLGEMPQGARKCAHSVGGRWDCEVLVC